MNICVFCGSATGHSSRYADEVRVLGKQIALADHTLVYGGGNIGLMGILADAVLQYKGQVVGVIPEFLLKREVGHQGLSRLEIVPSMHGRKKRMADLADSFIAMPGGWGTLDELAEILTWRQLGLIHQPVGILNINNFFDPLLSQMRLMVEEGFLQKKHVDQLYVHDTAEKLLNVLDHASIT